MRRRRSFCFSDAVAHHADKPQKRDPGERHAAECAQHGVSPRTVREPLAGVIGICGERGVHERESDRDEDGERNTCKRSRSRRPHHTAHDHGRVGLVGVRGQVGAVLRPKDRTAS